MHPRRANHLASLCATALLLWSLTGCSSDATGPEAALVATWDATSFVALGQDVIAQGMTLTLAFAQDGGYTQTITGDLIGACSPDPDCVDAGTYTATDTQITLDAGTPDEVTVTYVIQGTTMTITGTIDGTPITVTFTRA